MTVAEVLAVLLDLVRDGPPSARQVEARLEGLGTAHDVAGPNLDHPAWASMVTGAGDVYLTIGGDIAGVQVYEDSRGWGAYAEIAVRNGTLAEIESVVGPTQAMARAPDDFSSGERVASYVWRNGWTVRVFTEVERDGRHVRHVTVSYPTRETPPRPEQHEAAVRLPVAPPSVELVQAPPGAPPPSGGSRLSVRPGEAQPGASGTCPTCGTSNAKEASFCASCGTFLEW